MKNIWYCRCLSAINQWGSNHSNMNQQQQPGAGAPEDCKLFVYGVSIRTAKEELQAEFEKFGQVLDAYNSGKG